MTDKPEIVAWRYRYKGGKWTVQKNKPHWYKPDQADVELQPLVVASDAPSSALLAADELAGWCDALADRGFTQATWSQFEKALAAYRKATQ